MNRDIISSLASTFDGANAASCTAKRSETTVPQQTLFALNSVFIQDRAAAFSKGYANIEDAEQRVRFMYRQAYSREPQDEELETAMQFVNNQADEEADDRWQQLAHVLLAANEFVFVD